MNVIESIFREYDIRGTYPSEINEDVISIIGQAIALKCKEEGVSQTEQMFKMVKMCVNEIHDGETVYNHVDISNTDLEEFIDGMSTGHLEKVNSFFDTMPKLFHTVTVKNPNTEVESEVTLQGFDDFFV